MELNDKDVDDEEDVDNEEDVDDEEDAMDSCAMQQSLHADVTAQS